MPYKIEVFPKIPCENKEVKKQFKIGYCKISGLSNYSYISINLTLNISFI